MRLVAVTLALALVAGAACTKRRPSIDCYMAIDRAVQAAKPDPELPITGKTADKLRLVMQVHCKADRWSRSMLDCLSASTDRRGLTLCFDLLPPEQQDTLMADFAPVVSGRSK